MKVWIDKQHGRHYHKRDCDMVLDKRFPYQPVEVLDGKPFSHIRLVSNYRLYAPCPSCFRDKLAWLERYKILLVKEENNDQ